MPKIFSKWAGVRWTRQRIHNYILLQEKQRKRRGLTGGPVQTILKLLERLFCTSPTLGEKAVFARSGTTATVTDWEGIVRPVLANESRMQGFRRIENLLSSSTETARTTSFSSKWINRTDLTTFPPIDASEVTDFSQGWRGCTSLTTFPLLDVSSGTTFYRTWYGCIGLTSFPLLDVSSGTSFSFSWYNCSSLSSFPLLDVSKGTNFSYAWYKCTGLTSFPSLNMSAGTNFSLSWRDCPSLTSFPSLDVSSGTTFYQAWYGCSGLTSFPSLNLSSSTDFSYAWYGCTSLSSFPSGLFDTSTATNFSSAFVNCALDQTSVDAILVSINTAGTSSGTLNMTGGTSASPSATGLAAKTSLEGRGWTVTVN